MVSHLTLELVHTNKEGLLETPEGLAAWIGSCLNCNTNRAQVEVTTLMEQPPANALAAPSVPARLTPAQTVLLQVFATAEFAYILELKTIKTAAERGCLRVLRKLMVPPARSAKPTGFLLSYSIE